MMNLICKDCRAEQEGDAKVCAVCGGSLVYEIVLEMSPRLMLPSLSLKQVRIENIKWKDDNDESH